MLLLKVSLTLGLLLSTPLMWAESKVQINDEDIAEKALAVEELPNPWSGNARLGIIVNTGNTESQNYSGAFDLKYEKNKWVHGVEFAANIARSDRKPKAERYILNLDSHYFLREVHFLFADFDSSYDKFNAYDRIIVLVLGYGHRVLNKDNLFIDLKGGPGIRSARKIATATQPSKEDRNAIGLGEGILQWQITENSVFKQTLRINKGGDFTQTRSITALTTSIIGDLGVQLSYTWDHYSRIPSNSKRNKKIDTRTNVALVYSF